MAEALQTVLTNPAHAEAARRVAAEVAAHPSLEEAVVEMPSQTWAVHA
jgi:hypothetical protein